MDELIAELLTIVRAEYEKYAGDEYADCGFELPEITPLAVVQCVHIRAKSVVLWLSRVGCPVHDTLYWKITARQLITHRVDPLTDRMVRLH